MFLSLKTGCKTSSYCTDTWQALYNSKQSLAQGYTGLASCRSLLTFPFKLKMQFDIYKYSQDFFQRHFIQLYIFSSRVLKAK